MMQIQMMSENGVTQIEMNGFSVMEDEHGEQTVIAFGQQTDHAQQDCIAYFVETVLAGKTVKEIITSHKEAISGFIAEGCVAATTKDFSLVENRQSADPYRRWEGRVTERNNDGVRASVGYSDTPAGAAAFAMASVISYCDFAQWVQRIQPNVAIDSLSEADQAFLVRTFWQSQGRLDEEPGLTKGN